MPHSHSPPSWVVLAARFHQVVVERLMDGARRCLLARGVPENELVVVRVAGAFELPQALAALVRREATGQVPRGVVALGCVVRGETPHFDFVCSEASRGLLQAAMESGVAVGFGLLTCDTMEQALARAGGSAGDKGWEAAEAAWQLAETLDEVARMRGGSTRS